MYMFREDKMNIKTKFKQTHICQTVGLTNTALSNILNRKVACRKVVAYSITKYLDEDAEIEDYFEPVKGE